MNFSTASTLGARIRMVRKAWGWTQEDLARALGNDQQIVSYWERDKAKPTRSALLVLSQVFQLPVEALATGEGFTIPDVPNQSGPAHDLETLRCVLADLLKNASADGIQTVDLAAGTVKELTIQEAKAYLELARADGSTVLVVLHPGSHPPLA